MARKRMFDTEIITQDSFLDLPMESKALYFLLGMEADDEGFVNPNKVLRLYGGTQDGIKVLIAKEYIIPFKSGVVVITDWNTNNWLDKRRSKNTIYLEEKTQLKLDKNTNKYILAKPMLSECLESIEENRVEEYRIEENKITTTKDINIYEIVEKNFGRTIAPIEYEKINNWLLLFNEDILNYAIELCVLQNKKTFAYLEGILKNWKSQQYKTLEEIKENEKPKEPEWLNQEIKVDTLSKTEISEMEDLLSEFK